MPAMDEPYIEQALVRAMRDFEKGQISIVSLHFE